MTVLGDVGDDRLDLLLVVPELLQRPRGRLVDDCIEPPPTSFLNPPAEVGSMPVVSQSIMKPMVPVGASTEACACGSRSPCPAPPRRPRPGWPAVDRGVLDGHRATASFAAWCLRITRLWAWHYGRTRRTGRRSRPAPHSTCTTRRSSARSSSRPSSGRRRSRDPGPSPSAARRGWRSRCRAGGSHGWCPDRLGREVGEADRDVHRGDDSSTAFSNSGASKVSSSLRDLAG